MKHSNARPVKQRFVQFGELDLTKDVDPAYQQELDSAPTVKIFIEAYHALKFVLCEIDQEKLKVTELNQIRTKLQRLVSILSTQLVFDDPPNTISSILFSLEDFDEAINYIGDNIDNVDIDYLYEAVESGFHKINNAIGASWDLPTKLKISESDTLLAYHCLAESMKLYGVPEHTFVKNLNNTPAISPAQIQAIKATYDNAMPMEGG